MLKCKHFIKWKLCLKILTLTKTLAEKPPLHQAVTSSVSPGSWPSGVKLAIWCQGATHTSIEVCQASFKGYFMSLEFLWLKVRMCYNVNILSNLRSDLNRQVLKVLLQLLAIIFSRSNTYFFWGLKQANLCIFSSK